jgi:hypothetical protein
MGQQENDIREILSEIALKSLEGRQGVVMCGTVVAGSVDMDAQTCTVLLADMDTGGAGMPYVLLNSVRMDGSGLILYPADNSMVWVAQLEGSGQWGVLRCGELAKVACTIGQTICTLTSSGVHIEGGGKSLATVLSNLLSHIQALTVSTGTGPSGTPLNISDFVNDANDLQQILF